ncbi:MAG: DNA-directed RNA polymerase subunit omega [Deltaproteobacteria bacterium]|nr:MAG: DNA-directed RNA polymerase subunit omega [Deltaproteobacteria bacterium]
MARVTVEDCLIELPNRFSLVHLATKRALQLKKEAEPLVESENKEVVTALREIADRRIRFDHTVEDVVAGDVRKERRSRRRRTR